MVENELVPEPFQSKFSIPYSPMVLLEFSRIGFQGQMLWDVSYVA